LLWRLCMARSPAELPTAAACTAVSLCRLTVQLLESAVIEVTAARASETTDESIAVLLLLLPLHNCTVVDTIQSTLLPCF
jgi:hypothetical protein